MVCPIIFHRAIINTVSASATQGGRNKCSAAAEIGDRWATIDMGRKVGALPLWGRGSWVPIKHNVAPAEAYRPTKWRVDPSSRLATPDMG